MKKETKVIRDTIQLLAVSQSSASASIVNQIVNQGIKDSAVEAKEIGQEIPDRVPSQIWHDDSDFEMIQIQNDIIIGRYVSAFASIRNLLEALLRDILTQKGQNIGHISGMQLERLALKSEIINSDIIDAIKVVRNAANTIIHSAPWENNLPSSEVETIADLGMKTIYELRRIKNSSSG